MSAPPTPGPSRTRPAPAELRHRPPPILPGVERVLASVRAPRPHRRPGADPRQHQPPAGQDVRTGGGPSRRGAGVRPRPLGRPRRDGHPRHGPARGGGRRRRVAGHPRRRPRGVRGRAGHRPDRRDGGGRPSPRPPRRHRAGRRGRGGDGAHRLPPTRHLPARRRRRLRRGRRPRRRRAGLGHPRRGGLGSGAEHDQHRPGRRRPTRPSAPSSPRATRPGAAHALARPTSGGRSPRAGSSGWPSEALDIGVQYATERQQFGVPIGSFQAVQHRLADLRHRPRGRPTSWPARPCGPSTCGEPEALAFPAMAFCARRRDRPATPPRGSLHVHGGYGFMEEYDIQLYFRRAKAAAPARRRPARRPGRRRRPLASGPVGAPIDRGRPDRARPDRPDPAVPSATGCRGLDFRLPAEVESFRAEVREFLSAPRHRRDHRAGPLHRAPSTTGACTGPWPPTGWISAGWPAEFGGQGRSPLEMNALTEEMYLSGAPVDGLGIAVAGRPHPAHRRAPSGRRATIIPEILAGEVDDLPRLQRARRRLRRGRLRHQGRPRRRRVDHQRAEDVHDAGPREPSTCSSSPAPTPRWPSTRASPCSWCPWTCPGSRSRPVHTMGGERTNITYYDDVARRRPVPRRRGRRRLEGDDDRPRVRAELGLVRRAGPPARPRPAAGPAPSPRGGA